MVKIYLYCICMYIFPTNEPLSCSAREENRMKPLVLFCVCVSVAVHVDTRSSGGQWEPAGARGDAPSTRCSEHHPPSGRPRRGVQRTQGVVWSRCWRKHKGACLKIWGLNDATRYLPAKQRRDAGYRLFQHLFGSEGSGTA